MEITQEDITKARETAFVAATHSGLGRDAKSASEKLTTYREQHEKRAARCMALREAVLEDNK